MSRVTLNSKELVPVVIASVVIYTVYSVEYLAFFSEELILVIIPSHCLEGLERSTCFGNIVSVSKLGH